MKQVIVERVLNHANLFIKRDQTIRSVAKLTGWSRSTVAIDLIKRLPLLNSDFAKKINEKFKENKYIGQLKGGYTTQERYKGKRKKNG